MPTTKIFNLSNESVGELSLADDVFGVEVNEGLLYDVIKAQLASKRSGSANTKGRAEITATKKKMYKQKGTGRARQGNARAPHHRGGGVAHGPKPRDYSYRPNRKMRIGALKSALSHKLAEGQLTVVENFELAEVKTKALAGILGKLGADKSATIVDTVENEKLRLSARNLPKHLVLPPGGVNPYDLLRHEHLVITKDAIAALEARCKR